MLLIRPPTEILGVPVETDFKKWLKIGSILQSRDVHGFEKPQIVLRSVFTDDELAGLDALEAFTACVDFYNCGAEDRGLSPPKEDPYNWERDSIAIWGGFYAYYNRMDLDRRKMHWWKFMTLFNNLPSDSQIKRLLQVRGEDEGDYSGKGMEKARAKARERKRAAAVWPDYYINDDDMMGGWDDGK